MVKLKTDKAELESIYPTEPMEFVVEETGEIILLSHILDDALAAHEMKPEYDRMKANQGKVLEYLNSVSGMHFKDYEIIKEIKAILGGE